MMIRKTLTFMIVILALAPIASASAASERMRTKFISGCLHQPTQESCLGEEITDALDANPVMMKWMGDVLSGTALPVQIDFLEQYVARWADSEPVEGDPDYVAPATVTERQTSKPKRGSCPEGYVCKPKKKKKAKKAKCPKGYTCKPKGSRPASSGPAVDRDANRASREESVLQAVRVACRKASLSSTLGGVVPPDPVSTHRRCAKHANLYGIYSESTIAALVQDALANPQEAPTI